MRADRKAHASWSYMCALYPVISRSDLKTVDLIQRLQQMIVLCTLNGNGLWLIHSRIRNIDMLLALPKLSHTIYTSSICFLMYAL